MTRLNTLVVFSVLVACRPIDSAKPSLQVTIDSSGAYPIIESIGDAPVWNATLLHEIGAPGSAFEFGTIRSVLLDRRGQVYVVDPRNRTIPVFDSMGTFLRLVGRDGSGPGEYRTPYSIAWLDDQLALLDPGNARIGLFDSVGAWVTSWPAPLITGGNVVRLHRTPPLFWSLALRSNEGRTAPVFVRYSQAGPIDTMAVVQVAPGGAGLRRCATSDDAVSYFAAPFSASFITIPTPSAVQAVALTSRYQVTFVGSEGDTLRVLERNVAPTPITDGEWDSANGDWNRFRREWPTADCDRGDFARPGVKPPMVSMFHDDVGRLWVELVTPDGPRYEVFDTEGRLEATVVGLPPSGGIDPGVAGNRVEGWIKKCRYSSFKYG